MGDPHNRQCTEPRTVRHIMHAQTDPASAVMQADPPWHGKQVQLRMYPTYHKCSCTPEVQAGTAEQKKLAPLCRPISCAISQLAIRSTPACLATRQHLN